MVSGREESANLGRLFSAGRIVRFGRVLRKIETGFYKEFRKLLGRPWKRGYSINTLRTGDADLRF